MTYRPKTTLEQWRILQAVVDHDGYAKAAQALNKSQSSLNHAVSQTAGCFRCAIARNSWP